MTLGALAAGVVLLLGLYAARQMDPAGPRPEAEARAPGQVQTATPMLTDPRPLPEADASSAGDTGASAAADASTVADGSAAPEPARAGAGEIPAGAEPAPAEGVRQLAALGEGRGSEASVPSPGTDVDASGSGGPATGSAPQPAQQAPTDKAGSPRFDLVRVDPGGQTVIAGRAAPGAEITLRLDGVEVGRVTADATGQFVAFPALPPLARAGVLALDATDNAGTRHGAEDVILVPGAAGAPPTAQAALGQGGDVGTAPDEPADGGEAAAPAVAVLRSGPDGIETLQPATAPAAPLPRERDYVLIDTISYDAGGGVTLEGRADPNAGRVRVYLDNDAVLDTMVTPEGRWQGALRDIGPGTYTLRVDRLNEAGSVTARAESPFLRESREALVAATPRSRDAQVQAVTVQPGNTLWAIAREQYGSGMLYVRLFEANTDQIRDPDLIYPGQVFSIPE